MLNQMNVVDLAFVVDTTGSMGSLITAARRHMISLIDQLVKTADINLRLAVVQYRDHPPQEDSFVYRAHPFTANLKQAQETIEALMPSGGGDAPEAVFDGIMAACLELNWRKHARRLAVLVGDAAPHGVGASGDAFADGCPCGDTINSVSAAAEEMQVTFYALGLTDKVTDSFTQISQLTGGKFFPASKADAAIEHLATILKAEFGQLEFDRKVLAAWLATPDASTEQLASQLDSTRFAVSTALLRLRSRDLLERELEPALPKIAPTTNPLQAVVQWVREKVGV